MLRFVHDNKGAVTVFITLLLVPAVLVSGTAVDLASLYAARSYVKDANQLASNALLADYDELLRDLYALYAVTESDEDIQNTLTKYLQLSLFGDEGQDSGRAIHTNVTASASLVTVDDANLYNREILRRQIEEYVKLRAPEFFIEKVLDKIEKFTKFVPDLVATMSKISLEIQVSYLYDLEEQLYYSMRFHDYYIHDVALEDGTADWDKELANPRGMEYRLSEILNKELKNLQSFADDLQDKKEEYAEKKSDYMGASKEAGETAEEYEIRLQSLEEDMDDAKAAFEKAKDSALAEIERIEGVTNKQSADVLSDVERGGKSSLASYCQDVKNEQNYHYSNMGIPGAFFKSMKDFFDNLNPVMLVAEGVMATRLGNISGEKVFDSKINKNVKDYLDNIKEMEALVDFITTQEDIIRTHASDLRSYLPQCSNALRGTPKIPAMDAAVEKIEDYVSKPNTLRDQYNRVSIGIADKTSGYFKRLGDYLNASNITLDKSNIKSFSALRSAMDIPLEGDNPAGFDTVRRQTIKSVPYYEKIDMEGGQGFKTFCDDEDVCLRYGSLYLKHGDNSYWANLRAKNEEKLKSMWQTVVDMWNKFIKGISPNAKGEDMPPDVYIYFKSHAASAGSPLYEQAIDKLSKIGDTFGLGSSSIAFLMSIMDMMNAAVDAFIDLPNMFVPDAIVDKALLLSYDANMFSNYKTQDDGVTFTGYKFDENVNFMLGSEQEYIIVGSNLELVNQISVAGLLLCTRFLFNYISSFIVPTVNEICISADGLFLSGEVLRVVFSLAESLVDVYKLRGGSSVAIVKFMDSQWKTMPKGIVDETLESTLSNLFVKLQEYLGKELLKASIKAGAEIVIKCLLDGKSDTLIASIKNVIKGKNFYSNAQAIEVIIASAQKRGFANTLSDAFSSAIDGFVNEWKMKPDDKIDEPKGFWPAFTDSDRRQKLADLRDGKGDGDFFNKEMEKNIGKKLADSVANALTPSMDYSDYCMVFMFIRAPVTLSDRTADLIALNLGNYKAKNGGAAKTLAFGSAHVLDMEKARTAFGVKTDYELRLLFLSMPLAQKGVNGFVPQSLLQMSQTDYRGY